MSAHKRLLEDVWLFKTYGGWNWFTNLKAVILFYFFLNSKQHKSILS